MTKTIPLTARQPRPFTPPTLEQRWRAQQDRYDERQRVLRDPHGASENGIVRPDGSDQPPVKPVIYIAVPTLLERETIGSLMFELGVVQVSLETVRNVVLEQALEIYGDDKGEEIATFLETFWLQQQVFEDKVQLWQQQERQRVLDEWNDPSKVRDPYPMPEQDSPLRDRLRAKREIDQLIERSPLLRRTLGQQTDYGRQNTTMLIRVHCRGWEGLKTQREAIGADQHGGFPAADLLTEDCTSQLREELGETAWLELAAEIDGQYALSAEEVGNFASPPAPPSSIAGSAEPGEAPNGGNSPGTNTEIQSSSAPAPSAESGQITEPSSPSGGVEKD